MGYNFDGQSAQRISNVVRKVEKEPVDNTGILTPGRVVYKGGGTKILWGTLVSPWIVGTNNITLTPCNGPLDSTSKGKPNVSCYVQIPCNLPAQYLGANTGDILGYITTSGINVLFQVPLPRQSIKYQGWYNASGNVNAPNMVPDYLRAH